IGMLTNPKLMAPFQMALIKRGQVQPPCRFENCLSSSCKTLRIARGGCACEIEKSVRRTPRPRSVGVMQIWQQAVAFAARQHRAQMRGDGRTPYLAHPVRVALTIAMLFKCDDPDVIAAALLHDVLEKTGATYDELAAQFGP